MFFLDNSWFHLTLKKRTKLELFIAEEIIMSGK